jgi:hypothetical protein
MNTAKIPGLTTVYSCINWNAWSIPPKSGAIITAINKLQPWNTSYVYCCFIISIFINILFVDIHCKMVEVEFNMRLMKIQLQQLTAKAKPFKPAGKNAITTDSICRPKSR